GGLFEVRDCSPEYSFRFGKTTSDVNNFLSAMAAHFGMQYPDYPEHGAHCNSKGLTKLGETAIRALMDRKMVIDVDHMSALTRERVLEMAEQQHYPGLVSGHAGFTALSLGQRKSEGQLTPDEVHRLIKLGGMLATGLHQGKHDELAPYPRANGMTTIPNDC